MKLHVSGTLLEDLCVGGKCCSSIPQFYSTEMDLVTETAEACTCTSFSSLSNYPLPLTPRGLQCCHPETNYFHQDRKVSSKDEEWLCTFGFYFGNTKHTTNNARMIYHHNRASRAPFPQYICFHYFSNFSMLHNKNKQQYEAYESFSRWDLDNLCIHEAKAFENSAET